MKINWPGAKQLHFMRAFDPKVAALLAGVMVWIITLTFDALEHKQALRDQKFHTLQQTSTFSKKLESAINGSGSVARAAAIVYALQPDMPDGAFLQLAKQALANDGNIAQVDFYKDTTLAIAHPYEKTVGLIGMDLRQNPTLWAAYREMLANREPIVAGPFNWPAGTYSVIAYAPVFHENDNLPGRHFVGAVGVRMSFDTLLHKAGLADMEKNFAIAIRGINGEMLYGKSTLFEEAHVAQTVTLSLGNWTIAARPLAGWDNDAPMLGWWGGLLCVLGAALAYVLAGYIRRYHESEQRWNENQHTLTQSSIELVHHNTVLEMIVRHAPLPDVLMLVTRLVEMYENEMLCAIMLVNDEGTHLKHGAAPSLPDFFNQSLDGMPIGEGMGTCGTAAFRGERVVVDNLATHPYWQHGRALAQKINLRSCWAQPIRNYAGQVLGVFAIYHRKTTVPCEREIALIESYTALAALAIESNMNAETLRLHNAALNVAADAIVIADLDARIIWANQAFTRLTGYEVKEVLGHRCGSLLQTAQEDPAYYDALKQTVLSGRVWQGEMVSQRKDGTYYHDEMSITPIPSKNGVITHFVAVKRDITARKNSEEQLRNLAFYDALTKLPNRRLLIDRLGQALIVCKRSGNYGALMFLDLDNFKPLNDQYGHDIGDLLLIEAAKRITACVRAEDTVSRFGGDEFVVILENLSEDKPTSIAYASNIAEKIRSALGEPYFLELLQTDNKEHNIEHHCTSSIGITLFNSSETNRKTIMKCADMAMYKAKAEGRNRICFYEST